MNRIVSFVVVVVVAGLGATACDAPPRTQFVHWVARDAWDAGCAKDAIIEKWVDENRRFEERAGVKTFVVDVTATFKLVNACTSTSTGKTYAQFETVDFAQTGFEMRACVDADGAEGWARTEGRCVVGPSAPSFK